MTHLPTYLPFLVVFIPLCRYECLFGIFFFHPEVLCCSVNLLVTNSLSFSLPNIFWRTFSLDVGFLSFQIFFYLERCLFSFGLHCFSWEVSCHFYCYKIPVYNVSFCFGKDFPLLVTFIGWLWFGVVFLKFILLGVHWAFHWIFTRLFLCICSPRPPPPFSDFNHMYICFSNFFFLTSMLQF